MIEITCPATYKDVQDFQHRKSVFIAGGISNCPDWQREMLDELVDRCPAMVTLNPRRDDFDITDPNASSFQIEWEHEHLSVASAVLFWFPKETLCPITLYELGVITTRPNTTVFVGCHSEYLRKFDVVKQLSLTRPDISVRESIDELATDVAKWMSS